MYSICMSICSFSSLQEIFYGRDITVADREMVEQDAGKFKIKLYQVASENMYNFTIDFFFCNIIILFYWAFM